MFCSHCGNQIPDGAAFCPSCGQKLSPSVAEPSANTPANAPVSPLLSFKFTLPSLHTLIALGVAVLAFIFGFCSWIRMSYFALGKESFSVFHSNVFDISALIGLAKILMILSIILFVAYVATRFVDLNRFVSLPFKADRLASLAYFGVYDLSLLFALIGCFTSEVRGFGISTYPAVCWYLALIAGAAGTILTLKPEWLNKLVTDKKVF